MRTISSDSLSYHPDPHHPDVTKCLQLIAEAQTFNAEVCKNFLELSDYATWAEKKIAEQKKKNAEQEKKIVELELKLEEFEDEERRRYDAEVRLAGHHRFSHDLSSSSSSGKSDIFSLASTPAMVSLEKHHRFSQDSTSLIGEGELSNQQQISGYTDINVDFSVGQADPSAFDASVEVRWFNSCEEFEEHIHDQQMLENDSPLLPDVQHSTPSNLSSSVFVHNSPSSQITDVTPQQPRMVWNCTDTEDEDELY